jgi:hypothetical protein
MLLGAGGFWIAMAKGEPREALAALDVGGEKGTNLEVAWRAMAHGQLGELDKAFARLDSALTLGFRDVADLRTTRYWAPMRADPRWARTLAAHGIKP